MLIHLLMIACIVILLFNCMIYIVEYKCPTTSLKISKLHGSKYRPFTGASDESDIGMFTTLIRFDRQIPCGVYSALSIYGDILVFVNKFNNEIGYIYALRKSAQGTIKNLDWLEMWDFTKINSNNNFIRNYNSGCC